MLNELSAITGHVHICIWASLLFDIVLLSILPFTTDRAVCDETIFSVFNILLIRTVSSSSFGLVKEFYFLFLLLLFSCCVVVVVIVATAVVVVFDRSSP